MSPRREPIEEDVAATILFAADRTCCVCNVRGKPVQIHHVDENPSRNAPENLAVLCLECHDDTQRRGGFGRRLNAQQVLRYRDDWNLRVANRRADADRLAASAAVSENPLESRCGEEFRLPQIPRTTGLVEYIGTLPRLKALACEAAAAGWGGSTVEMLDATWSVVDAMVAVLARLARWYPGGHFGDEPRAFFSEMISHRAEWYHRLHSPGGVRFSGTIVGPLTAASVLADAERMVADMVSELVGSDAEGFSFEAWLAEWRAGGAEHAEA